MIYFVDIDNTICETQQDAFGKMDYQNAKPIIERIQAINRLYLQGHVIVYWTARGSRLGCPAMWFSLTFEQLREWHCLFNELRMGKPYYDFIIDDKTKDIEHLGLKE